MIWSFRNQGKVKSGVTVQRVSFPWSFRNEGKVKSKGSNSTSNNAGFESCRWYFVFSW